MGLSVSGRGQRGTNHFFVSEHHARAAANQCLPRAIAKRGGPQKITLDGYAASHEAVGERQEEGGLPAELTVRTSKYLNNLIEQDQRKVKQRGRPLLGFTRCDYAAVTLAGIELIPQLKKKQFAVSVLCPAHTRTPKVWEAVLAA